MLWLQSAPFLIGPRPNRCSAQLHPPPARVYDDNYSLVAEFVFAGEGEVSTINDVYVTKTAAYFTDSSRDKIYKVKGSY